MSWNEIVGHQAARDLLLGSIARGRLAHTYLFVGVEGIGKQKFALELAQCLLCQTPGYQDREACGKCPACKQVRARTHPDLYVVGCPEGKREIPIDTFLGPADKRGKAGLCYDLSHTPMAGGRKIALICDAERLNEESSNALLKTLEEPPPHSVIILIATHSDSVLPTIRSRCQTIRFNPLTRSEVQELLLRNGMTTDPVAAEAAAVGSDGSLTQARVLLDEAFRKQRERLFDVLSASRFDSLAAAGFVLERIEEAGSETAAQREQAGWCFRFCVDFFQSALSQLVTGNTSRNPQITKFATRYAADSPDHLLGLVGIIERTVTAAGQIDQNANVPLVVESLFDDMGRMLRSLPN